MLESVENGEQVGRYTFIGLQPFKRIVARGPRDHHHRGQEGRPDRGRHLRRAAARARRPQAGAAAGAAAVYRRRGGLFRLRRGAPDRAAAGAGQGRTGRSRRLPALLRRGAGLRPRAQGDLAGGHRRRDARQGLPTRTTKPSRGSTGWKSASLSRCPSCAAHKAQGQAEGEAPHREKGFPGRRQPHQGVHRGGRYFPGGALAALRRGAGGRQLPGLSRAAHRQSQPLYVLSALRAGGSAGRTRRTSRSTPPKSQKRAASAGTGGVVAGAAGARASGQGGVPAHRRNAPARRDRGRRRRRWPTR